MRIPFLHNVRRGLATNSSSSHSLVFHAEPVADMSVDSAAYAETEFGWDHFVLDSLGEKLIYGLTMAIGGGWRSDVVTPGEVARSKEMYGHLFPELDDNVYWARAISGYVDHQSRRIVNEELVNKLRDPHVVVHGGNDNGGYPDTEESWDEEAGKWVITEDESISKDARREMLNGW